MTEQRTKGGRIGPEQDIGRLAALRHRLYPVPVLGALVYLIFPPRMRQPTLVRRAVSWTSAVVAVLGIGMVAYPWGGERYPGFYRVPVEKLIEWSNFLSDMQTNRLQKDLRVQFAELEDPSKAGHGDPMSRIVIPKFGVDTIVVEGTSSEALKAGAGHYPQTPLPGRPGNVAIAGHRTTYGRPFNRVEQLVKGDKIYLVTPVGRYTYEVERAPWITRPTDWSVVDQFPNQSLLTLTSCHPKGSARERIIVRAKLIKSETIAPRAKAA
jgi:LPXTG-site transpeptidase (sortase) family protein